MDALIRPQTTADAQAALTLAFEAFGDLPPGAPAPNDAQPFVHRYVAEVDAQVVGRISRRPYDSWFGGTLVSTCGIAGVAVAAEHRGRGLAGRMVTHVLREAEAAGDVISTLFPTAPGIYRGLGYEVVAEQLCLRIPTSHLAVRGECDTARRATPDDAEAIRHTYERWAQRQHGPLSRRHPAFDVADETLVHTTTGVTVLHDDAGLMTGYVAWNRGTGHGSEATLTITELIALSPGAYRAALRFAHSHAAIASTTEFALSGRDTVESFLPTSTAQILQRQPYMARILHVCGALSARGYPPLTADLAFSYTDPLLTANTGTYRLRLADGLGLCDAEETTQTDVERHLTPGGLAALFAGARGCADLRASGLLVGGDPAEDPLWDAVFIGPALHIRDYF